MKAQFLRLSAAGFLLASATSFATASELQPVPPRAQARADRLLSAAGLDAQIQPVSVRASIDPDGRVTGVSVLRSSGSRHTDRMVETVLRRVIRADPPLGLTGGAVTLNVGAPTARADAG
jgi:TonB family protein